MSYFAYLAVFVGIPLAILSLITIWDYRRGAWQPSELMTLAPWKVILALCIVAFVYTTPWDNYLVASGVWFYNPKLVTGIVLGWVPLEEYTFFVLLVVLTGLWTLLLMRRMRLNPVAASWQGGTRIRFIATAITFVLWLVSAVILVLTFQDPWWKQWTYLTLILTWALIPIMVQLAFGADILARHWKIVLLAIATSTLYKGITDSIAITSGTWTIDPAQSLPILLGGILPIEEFLFFGIVNTLIVMGMVLILARDSQRRVVELERYTILRPASQRLQRILPQPLMDSDTGNRGHHL